jgi:Na+-driven multidrug efflux pump
MDAVKHMGEQSIGRLLLRYSLPAIAGFLANALYQIVDRILVGRGVGTDGMAAVTSAFPLSIVAMALGLLVGGGHGQSHFGLLGKRDAEGAERVLGQGLRLALINGTLLAVLTWRSPSRSCWHAAARPTCCPWPIPSCASSPSVRSFSSR